MAKIFEWPRGRVLIMGVVNVTPDSFSDGGRSVDPRTLIEAGADIIDVGGESTRPAALPVSAEEELRRVLPVIEQLAASPHPIPLPAERGEGVRRTGEGFVVSVDTTKAIVAEKALAAGARIVNDISALRFDERMADVVREAGAGVVLMHMQGTPATMQQEPQYQDVVAEVGEFLAERIAWAEARGIRRGQIAVDPGIGFGKTVEHNLQLLAQLERFASLGCPIVVGTSRKSFIGKVLNREVDARYWGTAATVAWAVAHGAGVVRVHDVAAMRDVTRMIESIEEWI